MIENLDIDLPSREMQDSIAQVLDSIQYKITLNNRLNDYLATCVKRLPVNTVMTEIHVFEIFAIRLLITSIMATRIRRLMFRLSH